LKQNILFIINPISGGKSKLQLPGVIDAQLDHLRFQADYKFTEYAGHATEIAEQGIRNGCEVVVAVGGDGTINEVATVVKQHNKILGVIPFGSGNGLARHLGIPMNVQKAIRLLNDFDTSRIDTGIFNGKNFYNIAGMGFDAHISSVFAGDKKRGFAGYVKLGLKEMISYRPQNYQLNVDGRTLARTAYAISIANSSQYGNNTYISPNASVTDGLLDVCIVKVFPLYKLPVLLFYAFMGKTDRIGMVEIIQGKNIHIVREKSGPIHIDGEPLLMDEDISISVDTLSLTIIMPG
jgi:YegS/Rv2252/BmrU family lipid kinase